MTFAEPARLLWLLALLPGAFLAWHAATRASERRRRLVGRMADVLAPGFSIPRRLLRDALALAAIGFGVVAWAGPEWGTWMREVSQRGVDVAVVLDTSRSMLAEDLRPSRLERAKREVAGLLDQLAGHRLALVTFAGSARLVCPLTSDLNTLRLFLDDVDTTSNAVGGTAVGEGLELALDLLEEDASTARAIVLLTDGEDHTSDPTPTEVAYRAVAMGIPIHVVALGTEEGATIPVRDARGATKRVTDADGNIVVTRPNELLLDTIASIADGAFLSAERTPFPLDEIYEKRIAVIEGVTRATSRREERVNRYQWALVLALLCIAARLALRDGVAERRAGAGARPLLRPLAALLATLALAGLAEARPQDDDARLARGLGLLRDAQRALGAGDLVEAQRLAELARVELPGSPLVAHTLGDVLYRAGQHDQAHGEYERGLDDGLRARARFNQAVVEHDRAERGLAEAGVPADPSTVPDPVPPQFATPIEEALPVLDAARSLFLEALDAGAGESARESIGAINRRIDGLRDLLERIEPPEDGEEGEDGEESDDGEPQDESPPDSDGDPSDDQQDQGQDDGDGEQDEQEPPEQPPPGGEQPPDGGDEDAERDEPPEDGASPTPAAAPRQLSAEELQRLLEQLRELEERGREFERARAAARRHAPEKDW